MKKIIHRLRRQPEETRRHVLHLFVWIAGFALFGLWVLSLGKNLTNPETIKEIKEDLKPFSALKENLTEGYKSISPINEKTGE